MPPLPKEAAMASKLLRKEVSKLKKEDLVASIKEMLEEEYKTLSHKDYAAIYADEYHRRPADDDDRFAMIAHNKNREMVAKLKKKELEDMFLAYLEIKDTGYLGPTEDVEPRIPSHLAPAEGS
jgi:hypothetical protein